MVASTQLINDVAIALEIPLFPNFLQEVEYNLNYVEQAAGSEIFSRIQQLVDQIVEASDNLTTLASGGQGAMIRADVIEWAPGGQIQGQRNELSRLRIRLARLLMLERLLGSTNTVRLVRW